MSDSVEMTRLQAITTARRMYDGGWPVVEIQRYLAARGQDRCWETIRGWADPAWADRRRRAHKEVHRRSRRKLAGVIAYRVLDDEAKLDTLERLRDAGLSSNAIAGAVHVFFGERLTEGQVRYAFDCGRYPRRTA